MNKYGQFQAKDIDDKFLLEAVWYVQNQRTDRTGLRWSHVPHWAIRWDVERLLPVFPERVIQRKAAALMARGLMQGCTCGCRGDYELTKEGLVFLRSHPHKGLASVPQE